MVMNQKVMRQTFMVLYFLLLSYNGVQGEKKRYSELEDLDLEKQLELLNKPAVKTIETTYGDLYDCVNFYKQPAFNHPLLRNHHFHPEMKPTLHRLKQHSGTSTTRGLSTIWLNGEGCPVGTVPIKRISKEDLIRQRHIPPPEDVTFDVQLAVANNSEPKRKFKSSQGYKVAIARTQNDPNNKFAGATMATSLWNPHVEGQQHSASRLKIQKGSDVVQVGWRVDPTLYGDTKTRLFIHFQAGKMHCFNTLCSGFVLVNTKVPIDKVYDTISQIGEDSWEDTMSIDRDLVNGNWWLLLEEDYKQIGFWPQRIFTDLKSFATNVEWGGVAYSPSGVPGPPMGSGLFPIGNTGHEAYCRQITILNDKGKTIDEDKTTAYADNPNLYRVVDIPHWQAAERQHFMVRKRATGPGRQPPAPTDLPLAPVIKQILDGVEPIGPAQDQLCPL
ncbi:protein neprosin-like [Nicotiana sylvestris]|uniref:protein neprosin-like n=1 Tax=Nicotiana sylvestris TaxID=4096 RepID=UPI00388CE9D4